MLTNLALLFVLHSDSQSVSLPANWTIPDPDIAYGFKPAQFCVTVLSVGQEGIKAAAPPDHTRLIAATDALGKALDANRDGVRAAASLSKTFQNAETTISSAPVDDLRSRFEAIRLCCVAVTPKSWAMVKQSISVWPDVGALFKALRAARDADKADSAAGTQADRMMARYTGYGNSLQLIIDGQK